jgi:cytidylate kinase
MGFVIAIDGPAASGKGTLARKLAAELGFQYLDTGKLYRLVAYRVLQSGSDPADENAGVQAAKALLLSLKPENLADPALMTEEIGKAASISSSLPGVRAALLETQRAFARNSSPGAVMDGRDIGTNVLPDAQVNLVLEAAPDVRATRRWFEDSQQGRQVSLTEVQTELEERDQRDRSEVDAVYPQTVALSVAAREVGIGERGSCSRDRLG